VISFLNFTFHKGPEQILYRYDLRERQTGELMTDRINFLFLEMPNAGDEEPLGDASFVQKLSWAFTHMSTLKERPVSLMGKVFEKFFAACEVTAMEYDKQQEYTEDMTTKWDIHDQIATAWEEGRDEGREEGRKEGLAYGEAKGKTDAIIQLADSMLADGLPLETVSRYTGLSIQELQEWNK
jgi:predicted transposase/invertase (TIGR01784 family)